MHRLLARQLKKSGIDPETASHEVRTLLSWVNDAYVSFDEERTMTERAMDISSAEMVEANQRMAVLVEASEAAVRSKSEFLANMSHEIRTPLTGIIGLSEMLLEEATSPRQLATLEMLSGAARGLVNVINDVLDLSKIESGKFQFMKEQFEIRKLINGVCDMFTSTVRGKELTVVVNVDDKVPQVVLGDEIRVRQVFVNLVGNAMKFNSRHGVMVIYVDVERSDDKGVELHCAVCDTGIGIPANKLESIFESFTQVDSSTSRSYGGTGLGLTICRRLIEFMAGRIWVKSIEKRGSAFHFVAPFETVSKLDCATTDPIQSAAKKAESPLPELSTISPIHILVAEDNAVNQKIVCHLLRKLGWQFTIAENGAEAVRLVERHRFDLILMDCQMPVLSGYDATRKIRELQRDSESKVPIIAMTAHAMEGDRERYIEAGMDDYISKPFDSKRAIAVLVAWTKELRKAAE